MGSGERLSFEQSGGFGFGIFIARFPFALTIGVAFLFWTLTIGLGRAYDAPETER